MGISLEHSKLFVPADRRNLSYVKSLFEKSADALVPQIMEAEIVHLSADP